MKKKQISGLFILMIVMAMSSTSVAQDMVFSTSDVGGEAVAPPPPPTGPPSESLANALRLYQQERYAQAAVQFQRIVHGETGDQPANIQKAQFFLGKCFYHLGFFQAALGVFEEIALMSTGHLYFQTSLQWLAQLSRELPEPAGIIGLVGLYGSSVDVLKEFNKKATYDLYNELLYLMGRYWYNQGEFAKGREFFDAIDKEHDLFTQAVFFTGIAHVRERKAQPAARAFLSIVEKYDDQLFLSDEEERFLNLAWLSLARIYYTTKHFDSAIEAWNRVPQSSEYYLDALFEESWAFFQVEQLSRALGNIHTINSPYFNEQFYPESLILKSVIYFEQCYYEDAQAAVNVFRKKYEPIMMGLQQALDQFVDNQSFFELLRVLRKMDEEDLEVAAIVTVEQKEAKPEGEAAEGADAEMGTTSISLESLSPELIAVIRGALADRTLLRNLEYVEILDKEEAKLKQLPPIFVNSFAGLRIQQDIDTAREVAVDNTGNLARSRYERLLGEIQELLNQATRVEIEILKALRGEIEQELQTDQEMTGPQIRESRIESDAEHMIWPFNGEYWRDELGYYRQPITSRCGR